jgi:hypothetical protein
MVVGHLPQLLLTKQTAPFQPVLLVLRLSAVVGHVLVAAALKLVPAQPEREEHPLEELLLKLVTSGQEARKKPVLVTIKTVPRHVMLLSLRVRLERAVTARQKHVLHVQAVVRGPTPMLLVPTTTPAMDFRLLHTLRNRLLSLTPRIFT